MRPSEMEAARLWDMLTYAREIHERIAGLTPEGYLTEHCR